MKLKLVLIVAILALLLAACGGSPDPEPVADTAVAEATVEAPTAVPTEEEMAEEEETAVAETDEEMADEEMADEEAAEEEAAEEEMVDEASGFGDLAISGQDAETGLEVNPSTYGPGDTFIVRGTVISMNLTPITAPEFLIESPDGTRYRIRSQSLDDTYFTDGSQWKPFEYRQGVGAMATVNFDASASLSDIPSAEDLVLVMFP